MCEREREREGRREESEEVYVAQALVSNIDSSKVAAACVLVLRFIYTTLDATYTSTLHMYTSAFCLLSILFLVMSTHTVHMYVCVCVCVTYCMYVYTVCSKINMFLHVRIITVFDDGFTQPAWHV